jgi:hypothetical protein
MAAICCKFYGCILHIYNVEKVLQLCCLIGFFEPTTYIYMYALAGYLYKFKRQLLQPYRGNIKYLSKFLLKINYLHRYSKKYFLFLLEINYKQAYLRRPKKATCILLYILRVKVPGWRHFNCLKPFLLLHCKVQPETKKEKDE